MSLPGTTATRREVNFFVTAWTVSSNLRQIREALKNAPREDWNRSADGPAVRRFEKLLRQHGVNLAEREASLPIDPSELNRIIMSLFEAGKTD
jgi:hypothetical protein